MLSPDEGGSRAPSQSQSQPSPPTSMPLPRKPRRPAAGGKRNQSNLSQEVRRSPERMDTSGHPSPTAHAYANPQGQHHHHMYQPGQHAQQQAQQTASPSFRPLHPPSGGGEAQGTYGYVQAAPAQQRPVMAHRHSSQSSTRSTPQMDTLAGEYSSTQTASRRSPADPAPRLPDLAAMQRKPFSRNDSSSSSNVPTRRSPSVVNQSSAAAPPIGRAISSQRRGG